ncbi:MAG: methionine synthase [Dehalococcoidia bacterium]|nr:methionine synthase [Dehalococcoidia bacterium]
MNALLTTTVGSFPKPPYLAKARTQFAAGKVGEDELTELTRKATREVIALQEELGIDILVHGEMERGDMVGYFGERLPGMKPGGLVRSYGNRYYHKPVIAEAVRWEKPMTLDWWQFAQDLTDRPVKGMLTGPYTIVEWSFDERYPSRRDAVLAVAEVIHQEARVLEDAGAQYIQIDEPAASTRMEDLPILVEAMAIVTDGLKAKTISHMCYGDFVSAYRELLKLPVDQLDLEMANSDYDLLDKIREEGYDKEIGLGVFDVHKHSIESVEEMKAGIKKGLEVLRPEQIFVTPDCGLKTRTTDEARDKLANMVRAAREVREEIGVAA